MSSLTVEELEVLIKTKVEDAKPQIRQMLKEIKSSFDNSNIKMDMSKAFDNIKPAVQQAKQQIKEVFDPNDISGLKINGKSLKEFEEETENAKVKVDELSDEIKQKLEKGHNIKALNYDEYVANLKNKTPQQDTKREISGFTTGNYSNVSPDEQSISKWDLIKQKIQAVIPAIQNFKTQLSSGNSSKQLDLLNYKISEIEEKLQNPQKFNMKTGDIIKAEAELEKLNQQKEKMQNSNSGGGNFFEKIKQSIGGAVSKLGGFISNLKQSTKGANGLKNAFTNITGKLKLGLGQIVKYASALIGLRSIYETLKSCASSWLSSQNAGAKQLSANIDYMKYAMGSAFAPVIEYVISLIYKLMKAIQSVVYALFKVNIFANASASSYSSMADSAKDAKKESQSLADMDEIHNIQDDTSDSSGSGSGSTSPSLDLSGLDTSSSILDAIENGDWSAVGGMIAEKINGALASIDWGKIQEGARNIATNIGNFINGFVEKLDWNLLGSTIGNGINTAFIFVNTLLTTINFGQIGSSIASLLNSAISTTDWALIGQTFANGVNAILDFGYNFVTTFDFKKFGTSIGTSISTFITQIDWAEAGQALSEGVKGIFDFIGSAIQSIDWYQIGKDIATFFENIDWAGIAQSIFSALGSALAGLGLFLVGLFEDAWNGIIEYFKTWIADAQANGGSVIDGLLMGILNAIAGIGQWIYDNVITPLVDGFCNALGIHSPSTVFEGFGGNIIDGLKNGLSNIWNSIKTIFENLVSNIKNIFNTIKTNITTIWNNIKTKITTVVTTIKTKVVSAFTTIKTKIKSIMTTIKTTITNIWKGIWNAIKKVINSILSGIESMANGIVKGMNKVIGVLNNLQVHIPDWIPKFGGKDIGFHISEMSTISIPRLKKGNVATSPTVAMFGEYSGARNNPEITTPQNIMKETFEDVLKNSNSKETINFENILKINSKTLAKEMIQDLNNEAKRLGYRPLLQRG